MLVIHAPLKLLKSVSLRKASMIRVDRNCVHSTDMGTVTLQSHQSPSRRACSNRTAERPPKLLLRTIDIPLSSERVNPQQNVAESFFNCMKMCCMFCLSFLRAFKSIKILCMTFLSFLHGVKSNKSLFMTSFE